MEGFAPNILEYLEKIKLKYGNTKKKRAKKISEVSENHGSDKNGPKGKSALKFNLGCVVPCVLYVRYVFALLSCVGGGVGGVVNYLTWIGTTSYPRQYICIQQTAAPAVNRTTPPPNTMDSWIPG